MSVAIDIIPHHPAHGWLRWLLGLHWVVLRLHGLQHFLLGFDIGHAGIVARAYVAGGKGRKGPE
jgi:hypothetical protein